MNVFSAAQLRLLDSQTIEEQHITSHQLMERAARICTAWLTAHYDRTTPFVLVCGPGNNGGDGFAITRMLREQGYNATAYFVRFAIPSVDCLTNINMLVEKMPDAIQIVEPENFLTPMLPDAIIADALLGTGTNRAAEGWVAKLIEHINDLPNTVVAIDIPSGLAADTAPDQTDSIVYADHTLSFQSYKRSMLHPEGGVYCGQIHVLDIELSRQAMVAAHCPYHILNEHAAKSLYRPRNAFSHKGTHGTALVAGGSRG